MDLYMQDTGRKVVTNTPRAGESAEQTAARTAPRNVLPRNATLAYLTSPSPGIFLLNLKFEGEEITQTQITRNQLGNIIADGAGMAFRESAEAIEAMKTRR